MRVARVAGSGLPAPAVPTRLGARTVARQAVPVVPQRKPPTVANVDSPLEREADMVADRIMAMPSKTGEPRVQRMCGDCANELRRQPMEGDEEEEELQLKPEAGGPRTAGAAVAAAAVAHGGQPLSPAERAYFEPRFGRDFSDVRVHDDPRAHAAADDINARAFALGSHIACGRGEYAAGTARGRHLLAHELTHVLQQKGIIGLLQRSCAIPVSRESGPACSGRIDVRAGEISLPNLSFFHLFIVFIDSTDTAYGLRGQPQQDPPGGGYGKVETSCGLYEPGFIDYDERAPSVTVYEGEDACNKVSAMIAHLNEIPRWSIPYSPNGPNSNSVVASMLRRAGLPLEKPNVAAPGFDMELINVGPADTPGLGDRRHRLLFMLRGSEDLSAMGLSYDIDVFETWGISFPIIIGADYTFNTGFLGSAGLGLEVPLVNLPTTPLAPTHLRLSGGGTAGFEPNAATDALDALVGGFFQANLGFDINDMRVSPFYRFDRLHNLETESARSIHSGGVQMGFAF